MTTCEQELELLVIIDGLQEETGVAPDQGEIISTVKAAMDLDFEGAMARFSGDFVGYLSRLCDKGLIDKTYKLAKTRWYCTDEGRRVIHEQLD